jgi:hypothetical protein
MERRGELAGLAIGEFGFNLLSGHLLVKGTQAVSLLRKAQKADALYSLEVMSKSSLASEELLQKSEQFASKHAEAVQKWKQDENYLKSLKHQNLSEQQIRQILHQTGYQTFPRPAGIPENFVVKFTDKGCGMKYVDPKNKNYEIRVMPGKPHSPFPLQQKPYVKQEIGKGLALDKNGNIVLLESPEAHIPLDEFIFNLPKK